MTPATASRIPELLLRAVEEARRLGHGWVGSEHLLMALLAGPSLATEVLAALGLTYDRLAERLGALRGDSDWPEPPHDPDKGLAVNPAGHALVSWAQGLATAWGSSEPAPEHWLLAMVYDAVWIPSLLYGFGITQQAVLDALRVRNVRLPEVDPPVYKPWRGCRRVEVTEAQVGPVLRLLRERHPPSSEWRWGFNWLPGNPRRARFDAEEGINLTAIVAEIDERNPDDDDAEPEEDQP